MCGGGGARGLPRQTLADAAGAHDDSLGAQGHRQECAQTGRHHPLRPRGQVPGQSQGQSQTPLPPPTLSFFYSFIRGQRSGQVNIIIDPHSFIRGQRSGHVRSGQHHH